MNKSHSEFCRAVDDHLAREKSLTDRPHWTEDPANGRQKAKWLIETKEGICDSYLSIRHNYDSKENLSASLIFRDREVCRVDLAPATLCKPNPPWAHKLKLPPTVFGSHIHSWEHNRE